MKKLSKIALAVMLGAVSLPVYAEPLGSIGDNSDIGAGFIGRINITTP